ncbi:alpha/beta fold hydrolase, partial [Trichloromonas sp.]|uniref:alpha/beta fold hydrolase n=1 Tax=Trichloromonas sp. TaxID=3069249 RepID=UPI003D812CFB
MFRIARLIIVHGLCAAVLLPALYAFECHAAGSAGQAGQAGQAIRAKLVAEPVFGGSAYILEAGDRGKPPLVLVHGLGDMASDTWRLLLPVLAESYHVVTFDLPGFGRSQKQNSLYSPGNYAAFVKWVVDTFVGMPPVLAGHSLGGAIALRYAGTYPDALSRLVLIDVAGILDRRVYTKEMLSVLSEGFVVPFDVDNFLGKMVGRLPNPLLDLDMMLENELLRSRVLGGDPVKIAAMALIQENFSPYLFRVRVPAVILWGENDRVTPRRTGTLLEANLPAARLQIIPGAGHVPMAETPRLFEAAFLAALQGEIAPAGFPAGGEGRTGRCEGSRGMVFEGA